MSRCSRPGCDASASHFCPCCDELFCSERCQEKMHPSVDALATRMRNLFPGLDAESLPKTVTLPEGTTLFHGTGTVFAPDDMAKGSYFSASPVTALGAMVSRFGYDDTRVMEFETTVDLEASFDNPAADCWINLDVFTDLPTEEELVINKKPNEVTRLIRVYRVPSKWISPTPQTRPKIRWFFDPNQTNGNPPSNELTRSLTGCPFRVTFVLRDDPVLLYSLMRQYMAGEPRPGALAILRLQSSSMGRTQAHRNQIPTCILMSIRNGTNPLQDEDVRTETVHECAREPIVGIAFVVHTTSGEFTIDADAISHEAWPWLNRCIEAFLREHGFWNAENESVAETWCTNPQLRLSLEKCGAPASHHFAAGVLHAKEPPGGNFGVVPALAIEKPQDLFAILAQGLEKPYANYYSGYIKDTANLPVANREDEAKFADAAENVVANLPDVMANAIRSACDKRASKLLDAGEDDLALRLAETAIPHDDVTLRTALEHHTFDDDWNLTDRGRGISVGLRERIVFNITSESPPRSFPKLLALLTLEQDAMRFLSPFSATPLSDNLRNASALQKLHLRVGNFDMRRCAKGAEQLTAELYATGSRNWKWLLQFVDTEAITITTLDDDQCANAPHKRNPWFILQSASVRINLIAFFSILFHDEEATLEAIRHTPNAIPRFVSTVGTDPSRLWKEQMVFLTAYAKYLAETQRRPSPQDNIQKRDFPFRTRVYDLLEYLHERISDLLSVPPGHYNCNMAFKAAKCVLKEADFDRGLNAFAAEKRRREDEALDPGSKRRRILFPLARRVASATSRDRRTTVWA